MYLCTFRKLSLGDGARSPTTDLPYPSPSILRFFPLQRPSFFNLRFAVSLSFSLATPIPNLFYPGVITTPGAETASSTRIDNGLAAFEMNSNRAEFKISRRWNVYSVPSSCICTRGMANA